MKDVSLKSTQKELKAWVKHHVPVRGDRILWGKPLFSDMKKKKSRQGEEVEDDPEGSVSKHEGNDLNNTVGEQSQEADRSEHGEEINRRNERRLGVQRNNNVMLQGAQLWRLGLMVILVAQPNDH